MAEPPYIAPALLAKSRTFRWDCPCGARKQPIRLDRSGKPYALCESCFRRVFWKNSEKFLSAEPFCRHEPSLTPTKTKGRGTSWCRVCLIRVFAPI